MPLRLRNLLAIQESSQISEPRVPDEQLIADTCTQNFSGDHHRRDEPRVRIPPMRDHVLAIIDVARSRASSSAC